MKYTIRHIKNVLLKPVDSYNELKYIRYINFPLVFLVLISWLIVDILARQFYGFRFNYNNPDDLNIFIQLLSTVILFLLFCISNWAICTIVDGEGKFGEICTFLAISLIPYIIFKFISIFLSNVLVLEEKTFLDIFLWIGILWTSLLFFQALRIVHNYSSVKTVVVFAITICLILIIFFIVILVYSLFQQIYSFGNSIYSELVFRR